MEDFIQIMYATDEEDNETAAVLLAGDQVIEEYAPHEFELAEKRAAALHLTHDRLCSYKKILGELIAETEQIIATLKP